MYMHDHEDYIVPRDVFPKTYSILFTKTMCHVMSRRSGWFDSYGEGAHDFDWQKRPVAF